MTRAAVRVAPALALAAASGAVIAAGATAATRTAAEFIVRAHGTVITCAIYDGRGVGHEAMCESVRPGRESKATVNARGRVAICVSPAVRRDRCNLGNAGVGTPTVGVGHTIALGRFRCAVGHAGVRCTVAASGRGFLFGPGRAVRVGVTRRR
ncbi:MAG: hypothetical protein KGJ43_01575 [Acidobacteriota bacterium]|nr:hypothetical protein [Acidobacteriota bacterium]